MGSLVIFSHGKESGPWGSKITHLAEIAKQKDVAVLSPDYRDLVSPEERVERLLSLSLPPHDQLVLVGSSMGGYVATLASETLHPAGLFLLAPAFYFPGYANQAPSPVARHLAVVHGWSDDVVPPENSIRFCRRHDCALHMLPADHRLDGAIQTIGGLFGSFLEQCAVTGSARSST